MRLPCQSRSTRLFGQRTRAIAAAIAPRCSHPSAWARHRSSFGLATGPARLPSAPDDHKLFDRPIVVEDATLLPSRKLRSWT
jgi:hypothetical protein